VKPPKFGILSTADVGVQALILTGRNHREIFYAIAGRNKEKIERFAGKYGIKKVYFGQGGYQSDVLVIVVGLS
jgi:predicted dehydrogenase